jgi:hypothetical protein
MAANSGMAQLTNSVAGIGQYRFSRRHGAAAVKYRFS